MINNCAHGIIKSEGFIDYNGTQLVPNSHCCYEYVCI